jgi:hypothetical protein
MPKPWIPTALLLATLAGAPARGSDPATAEDAPAGEYAVVALRRSSHVEGGPEPGAAGEWLGQRVSFGERLAWLDGVTCDGWTVRTMEDPPLRLDDPNLSDLAIAPVDAPTSAGDKRVNRALDILCDGRRVGSVIVVDRRVLVTHGPAGVVNAILERPLAEGQVRELQARLKDMKFYAGEATGELDAATLRSVSLYADDRGAEYAFHRPAITENLLDGLRVLPDE